MKKVILLVICIIIFSSCSMFDTPAYMEKSEFLLGTLVSVKIYDFGEADKFVLDECFTVIRNYEQKYSYYESDSELSLLNRSAYNNPYKVSDELFDIIYRSLGYCTRTDGAFDIGLGSLIGIWDKATADGIPPDSDQISGFVGFKAYEHIVANESEKTIMFTDERVSVHLGACAKGYLEDIALSYLRDSGVKSAVLDFGGSVAVLGDKNGVPFQIGITNPSDENTLIGSIGISDNCVVTSGDYRRYFMYNDVRYHHILDSRTAYPALSDINGVSVLCESAFTGDCLSTAAFVAGSEAAADLILSENCGYIIITDDSVETSGVVLNEEIK